MSKYFEGLNNRQLIAVRDTLDQPTLVLAGAGSGKTGVLTRRTAYLMGDKGVDPKNIMVVTFTTKAAKEMKERVAKLVGESKTKRITMGTFHSIALQILRKHGKRIGLKQGFGIYDTDDQKQLMRQALAEHGEGTDANNVRAFLGKISDAKNKLITPNGYQQEIQKKIQQDPRDATVHRVYESYQNLLDKNNAVDFDDLIMKATQLLEKSAITRKYYQDRYEYVSVDEYQDTNPAQYKMIKLISGNNNLFVVGDDYQAIYGFRGSDISIILNFEEDHPNCKIVKLEQNYRSKKTIVHAGNSLMAQNPMQKHKVLFTENPVGDKMKVHEARDGLAEARFVINEIQNLVQYSGRKYGDFAVLYRLNFLSQEIERELTKARIPYNIVGGVGFYERMEIKDTLAYLRVIANPYDDIAMRRVLNVSPGIGKTTIANIEAAAEMQGQPLVAGLKLYTAPRKNTQDAISVCRETLNELHKFYKLGKEVTEKPVSDMLDLVWRKTGYMDNLKAIGDEEAMNRVANLQELAKVAAVYEKDIETPNLVEFLEQAALTTSKEEQDINNKVQLMSIHASKGLEFPVVFNVGWEEGVFPSKRALTPDEVAEERRLAYVAITRAEDDVYLLSARQRMVYRSMEFNSPSRFIEELPDEVVTTL
jgi:DNA helicase II / ATP-dependent DNA helicase PcrA